MLKNENVSIFGDGSEYGDYIYIDDIIEFVLKAIIDKAEGTFNISSGKITKTIEIYNHISNIIGYEASNIS